MSVIRFNIPMDGDYDNYMAKFNDYYEYIEDFKNCKKPLSFIFYILGVPLFLVSFILRCVAGLLFYVVIACIWIQNGDPDSIVLLIIQMLLRIPSMICIIIYFPAMILFLLSLLFMLPYYIATRKKHSV